VVDLLKQLERTVASRKLLSKGESALVAVSGGLDSVVLLQALYALSRRFQWRLFVAHFNHRLRGSESEADERFVRRAAKRLKLKCIVENADVAAFARREGVSVEMAARRLRHEFFTRTARCLDVKTVALAHHADDQVEQFFLRLFRGSGGEGLAGMKWISTSPCDPAVKLIRPLLDQPKSTLRAYAAEHGLTFREDSSNAQLDFLRNRIRNKLLPQLTQLYQPALGRTVRRAMDVVGAEAEFVSDAARGWLSAKRRVPFRRLHTAVQRRAVQLQLVGIGIAPEFELIEQLRLTPDRWLMAPPGLSVRRRPDGRVVKRGTAAVTFGGERARVELEGNSGAIRFGGLAIKWRKERRRTPDWLPRFASGKEFFDADRIGSSIVLRHWQRGDRFQPAGMPRPVKLQDLFTNMKFDRDRRHRLVVAVTSDGDVFWVEGVRISERFKLGKETKRCLEWRWRR